MTQPAVQTGHSTRRTIQKARLDGTRRRAELIFRRSARAALELLRQAIDPERLAWALTQYGSYTAIQQLPWEAFGLRLSADFLRIFRDVYEAAGDQAAAKLKARLLAEVPLSKYSPDQPRVPAGSPEGGEWTAIGYRNEVTDAYSGQVNGRMTARLGDKVAGYLEWQSFGGVTLIAYVHVAPEFRRRGIATELAQRIQADNDEPIEWGTMTPEGAALRAALQGQIREVQKANKVRKDVTFATRVENWGFDVLNPRGLDYLRRYGGARIVQISNETRQAVRVILSQAYNQGLPALETAKRIKTEIGLTAQYAQAVENLRTRLEDEGVAPARVDVLVARKARDLLDLRALTISRTEATFAAAAGTRESLREAAEQGLFDPQQAVRVWVTAEDEQVCPICEPLDGVESDGVDGTWMTEDGPISDPPAHVNCRCDTDLRL